ncbi:hypothetical protein P256_00221 [Acinetobacter nectaris CIP 110549]|uniref:HTH cro/C1-type domain-containing protein n=1 Tax=Acinetobacter nectaris CIP 110549 TaxID=1392540 RepID=V2TUI6_9GAMM|nr:type II toxin-antitoxin system MqsA family antitoxin [Acinetobacter nectaris]ESK41232.1 hypothetical protein P256_00221 [Acinetobacter nectaris CIP 110549]
MKNSPCICPICEENQLFEKYDRVSQTYNGKEKGIPLFYSECACCGSETVTKEQAKKNKREMIKFKREVDNLLSHKEIREIRKGLGLSIEEAGKLFGGGPVAFSKYENNDLIQSLPMDTALRLATPESIGNIIKAKKLDIHLKAFSHPTADLLPLEQYQTIPTPVKASAAILSMSRNNTATTNDSIFFNTNNFRDSEVNTYVHQYS